MIKLNDIDGDPVPDASLLARKVRTITGFTLEAPLVGKSLYLTITRPYLFYVAHSLNQFSHSPRTPHFDVLINVFYVAPRLFALEVNKDCSVADKLNAHFTASFRRQTRGGPEAQQLEQLTNLLDSVSLSNMEDRCFWDLNGEEFFKLRM
ncbi:hypothetical protein Tco_0103458 [Tanacetum coccineum]